MEARSMAQVGEYLLIKHKILSSNPISAPRHPPHTSQKKPYKRKESKGKNNLPKGAA
jgi:hypothetical protein